MEKVLVRPNEQVYQIVLSYACGGVIVENDLVKRAAPIFNWMVGKDIGYVQNWVCGKRGSICRVK